MSFDSQIDVFKSFTNDDYKFINYNQNIDDVIFNLELRNKPIKLKTDFKNFCLVEITETLNVNNLNIQMIFNKKEPDIILNTLLKIVDINNNVPHYKFADPFHIYQKIEEYTKYFIDYDKLVSGDSNSIYINKKIPKEQLLTPKQINHLLINEIKKINRSKEYLHYIVPDNDNPYSLFIRFQFSSDTIISKTLSKIKQEYIEIKLNIDPKAYPFFPPKLEYIKPKIKLPLLLGMLNINILKYENWNSTITLEYFIIHLGKILEKIASDYIDLDNNSDNDELEYQLVKLSCLTNDINEKVNIDILIPKKEINAKSSKYWNSGTGYGYEGLNDWDIKNYIQEQEVYNTEIVKIFKNINELITDKNIDFIFHSILSSCIINQIKGLSLLELEKNIDVYVQVFHMLSKFIPNTKQDFINDIGNELEQIKQELDLLFEKTDNNDENILQIYCTMDWYIRKKQIITEEIIISDDEKIKYERFMKDNQFAMTEINSNHLFYKHKNEKPNQKSLMRILSEISSFKSGLPLNWESSIWIKVPKDSINLFTFIISGPKDTPYENGLFEFHVYLPPNYPNDAPNVLLNTTGNGTVRFNPNLYHCGKVCLSLLGTWAGQESEKWNPKTSTFMQVMVSIQSLILVEKPYFNEPGYEREMGTQAGTNKSNKYNSNLYASTINYAMIDMIKSSPSGYDEVIKQHFKMKKNEIINRTEIWEQNANPIDVMNVKIARKNLIELLESLE